MSGRLRSPARQGSLRLALAVASGLALGGAGVDARAEDQATAEQLFDRGRKLMERNSTLGEACRTLEESLKLWDRGDTVLNLAECHRRQGKTATAWAEFGKALNHGTKVGFPEAIQAATRLRDALEAKLSKLTVTVPPATAALEGLTVEVSGTPWPRDRWNTAFVLDPGPIQIRARAKGYKPFDVQVELGADKDAKSVDVVLEIVPPPPPPPPPPPLPPRAPPIVKPSLPLWPWIVGAAGVALGGAAIGSELVSLSAHNELDTNCGTARKSCPLGYDFQSVRNRETFGFGFFVGLGTGGLLALGAAGAGLGLSLRASSRATTQRTTFLVSPTNIAVRSTF